MKGIVLAGGKGTRLYPVTKVVSKQLLPLYDKPLIYYSISVLIMANIRDILIISTPEATPLFKDLFGDGSKLGLNISYAVQDKPRGLADAFIIGEEFIGNDSVCLILGDNFFYGQTFKRAIMDAMKNSGATVFGYLVKNPKDFGVVEFDKNNNVISIEEKPQKPKSNFAVPGLYFYDNRVVEIAKTIKPSSRGELEITAINDAYLKMNELHVSLMGRGLAWMDTGSPKGMLKASEYVEMVQSRQGWYISCIEEMCWRNGYITRDQMRKLGEELKGTEYGDYLISLADSDF